MGADMKQSSGYKTTINGHIYYFDDPKPDARQLLHAAGMSPADEAILIQVFEQGSRAIGLDETVDLKVSNTEEFWAFKTDRIFRFTVNERGFDWGEATIQESMLRKIAHVNKDNVLVLERQDEPDRDLGPEDSVVLSDSGTEHIHIEKVLVTVYFKNDPYHLPRGIYTTEQLTSKFPIEDGYLLNLKTPDNELVTLQPGQKIHIKEGMHFYSQVPGGGSS
jgi:hypothetical protein